VLATGLAFPLLETFYTSTSQGVLTLPALVDAPYGVVVAAIVAAGMGMFYAIERFERRA
jgi:hypothetical protein